MTKVKVVETLPSSDPPVAFTFVLVTPFSEEVFTLFWAA
jgi:hypothetical protein